MKDLKDKDVIEGRNYEKFFTPDYVADVMAQLLEPEDGGVYLEPSAGNGSLVRALMKQNTESFVFAFEVNEKYRTSIKDAGAKVVVIKDFLSVPVLARFTGCIANPPFGNETNFQDHFDAIRLHVKKGGKVVMITPFDFNPKVSHNVHKLQNWSTNSDGTTTKIKIIEFVNP